MAQNYALHILDESYLSRNLLSLCGWRRNSIMSLGIFLSVDVNRPMLKIDKCGNIVDKVL